MSARFWLFSLASAGAALTSGLTLGLYATTSPRVAFNDAGYASFSEPSSVMVAQADGTDLAGPDEIDCKGCGPTLAQRQMTAVMGDWTGYDDAVVRRYEARGEQADADWQPLDDPPPSPAHRLPQNIESFAEGDEAPRQPTQLAQSGGATFDQAPVATVTSY